MNHRINKKLNLLLLFLMMNMVFFSQEDTDDCIFDLKTQDDSFLFGIDELKNYSWDSKNKIASIEISDTETIKITRGGCNEFILKAEFKVPKNTTFKNDKQEMLNKTLWISNLIFEKSDYIKIHECLTKNQFSVDESNPNNIHINFLDNRIYNSYTFFYTSENENFNTFSIEYFLN